MKYIRSRPWRSRGPWFCNRAGARRRGRRDDEVVFAGVGEITDEYGDGFALAVAADAEDVVTDDVLLPVAATWPMPGRMQAASVDEDQVLAVASGQPTPDWVPRRLDHIGEAIVVADVLSRQRDDSATSRSRQSA